MKWINGILITLLSLLLIVTIYGLVVSYQFAKAEAHDTPLPPPASPQLANHPTY